MMGGWLYRTLVAHMQLAYLLSSFNLADKAQYRMGKMARKGEADRHIPDLMPKHLHTGKRGIGKTDRR